MSLEGVHLLVAIPCYGGNMTCMCTMALFHLDKMLRDLGVRMDIEFIFNESLIPRARNQLAHTFLQSSCTHLLFVDADIQFRAEDVVAMLQQDLDVLGGVYAKKEILWDRVQKAVEGSMAGRDAGALAYYTSGIVFVPLHGYDALENHPIAQPVEAMYVGTGLMLIKRRVLETMRDAAPERAYESKGDMQHLFFDCVLKVEKDGCKNYLSEDYYFCERWRELGGAVHAALWTQTVHYGTFGFRANTAEMV